MYLDGQRTIAGAAGALAATLFLCLGGPAAAQQTSDPQAPDASQVPDATQAPQPEATTTAQPVMASDAAGGTLRLHVIDTRRRYPGLDVDIYDAATGRRVASTSATDEGAGEAAATVELSPGLYKIVRDGAQFNTWTDFATVQVEPGETADMVIVLDETGTSFVGSGRVVGALPEGRDIAGVRVSLSGGGSLMINTQRNVVGQTPGTTSIFGVFANFGLVYDEGNHYLDVRSDLELNLLDEVAQSIFATTDSLTASALYAFNIGNEYIGPYAKAGVRTSLFPSYLWLQSDTDTITVNTERLDGTTDTETFGTESNRDDLRVELAPSLAPWVLQEEIGGNLKAFELDLRLVQLNIASRIGYAFRQGLTNGLLVLEGDGDGDTITLREVDDYSTHGPIVGADAQVTVTRWLFGKASAGVIAPLADRDRAGDGFGDRLLWDLSATGGFRLPILTDLLEVSLDYTVRFIKDGYLTEDTQIDQNIMARGRVTLF